MTKGEFQNVIQFVETGSRRKLEPDQRQAYWRILSRYPFKAVMRRAEEFFDSDRGLRGMPEIADLRGEHQEIKTGGSTVYVKCDRCSCSVAVQRIVEVDSGTGEGRHRLDLAVLNAHSTQHAKDWMREKYGKDESKWPAPGAAMLDSLRKSVARAERQRIER